MSKHHHNIDRVKHVKRCFILLFLTTYSLSLAAQDTLGFTNKTEAKNQMVDGKKEGKWAEYFDKKNGIVADTAAADFYSLTIYKADKPFGMARRYTKLAKLVEEDPYSDAGLNGVKKEYFVSGKLRSETPYSKGKINGTKKIYFESGVLYREAQFDMGKPNGLEKYYYASGKLKSILKYIPTADGQFSILEKDYDEQGNEIKE
ncbi:MAG TPA: hypothetical protein VNZ45_15175 [Bacteroidia bacterium]|jgi:antitoxin component YwqK of YwqJK toxin-antitoxin module|nr:hypothetical protein [Bacteroidia bacterium]